MSLLNIKFISLSILVSLFSFVTKDYQQAETIKTTTFNAESLEGSVWQYEDEDLMYEIRFTEGGVLVTSHPHDITPGNDTWNQENQKISFSYNDAFSVYEGEMVSEDLIVGKAHNRSFTWEWKAYRISEKKPEQVLASTKAL
ncbi:MAG: hypothetical protein CMO01_06270 [Thalassobius sp.]|nr:hypothetical protein [Thalassovita sp.]